jgi:hypothetical protein
MASADDRTVSRLGAAVRQARRGVVGGAAPMLEQGDLDQEAAIAEWRANVDPARSQAERESYLRIRRSGAMVDAAEAAADPAPMVRIGGMDDDMLERVLPSTPDTQLGEAALLRACDEALALPDPLPLIFVALLAGTTHEHLAAHLGVSRVRVTQLCGQLRVLLFKHLQAA